MSFRIIHVAVFYLNNMQYFIPTLYNTRMRYPLWDNSGETASAGPSELIHVEQLKRKEGWEKRQKRDYKRDTSKATEKKRDDYSSRQSQGSMSWLHIQDLKDSESSDYY